MSDTILYFEDVNEGGGFEQALENYIYRILNVRALKSGIGEIK